MVSATWSSQSVDSGAFQWEDRSFSSQIEQQRFAYSVGPPLTNSFFCVSEYLSCTQVIISGLLWQSLLGQCMKPFIYECEYRFEAWARNTFKFSDREAQMIE